MAVKHNYHLRHAAIVKAMDVEQVFVRSDVQINRDNPKAKGRKMSAAEVVFNFGEHALRSIIENNVFVIQNKSNASSITIMRQLERLRIPK